MKMPAVYILASKPRGTLYVGVTSDLVRRIWEHREGVTGGFTERHGIKRLVWYEQHQTMLGAIAREKVLKRWTRPWKFALIQTANPRWRDLWPNIVGLARPQTPANQG
jgi:putative endonuclease